MREDSPVIVLCYDNDYGAVIAINSILTKSIEPCKLKTNEGLRNLPLTCHILLSKLKYGFKNNTLLRFKGKIGRGKVSIIL